MVHFPTAQKAHSACDGCRSRKLKCSGDIPTCVRCERERMECVYSPQKQMGRPKKRRREGEGNGPSHAPAQENPIHSSRSATPEMMGRFNPDLTPQPILHDIRRSGSSTDGLMAPMRHDVMPLTNINDTAMIDPNFDLTTPVDPSFWPSQISTPPNQTGSSPLPCACLSLTYLTLNTLHTLNDFSFPQIVPSLRTATTTLSTLIHCPTCPLDPFSATQNLQSIVSLFKALVLRFNKVLLEVDAEATRLMQNSEKKPFRVGDNSAALAHLHTGTPDCPMGFNIQLEAREWSKIVKTALRTEVWGGGSNTKPLVELLAETEERQRRWHAEPDLWKEEMGHLKGGRKCAREGICEALGAEHIRRSIEELVWE